jgi:putrescine transport system ATP-binding protein
MIKKNPKLEAWQDPKQKPYIEIENISKDYEGVPALNHISLSIYKGELFSLLGPSGCGKSSLLRILSGLEKPSSGKIYINGVDITHLPPYERPVNMMFQSYALFPHMTVEQNVAFGLKQEHIDRQEITTRVKKALKLVRMDTFMHRKPHQLSGGQRQRVALARSLIKKPKLVLLDEPLAALDKQLRNKTQFELVNIQEEVGVTFIMVTHDQEEAMTMSTRVGIMEDGRLRQIGTPNEVYEYPNSRYVAGFIGTTNMFEAIILEDEPDHVLMSCDDINGELYINSSSPAPIGAHVAVAVRPEKIMMSTQKTNLKRNWAKGTVEEIAYLGDVSIYYIRLESGKRVMAQISNLVRMAERPITWNDVVYIYWRAETGVILYT